MSHPTSDSSTRHPIENIASTEMVSDTAPVESVDACGATGLPFWFVALSAAGIFLYSNREKLGQKGGFIFVIGAVVLGVLSGNMLGRR